MYHHHHDISDGGRTVLTDPPAAPAIALKDAKQAMGIALTDTSQDLVVSAAISAACDALDPAAGGWLGRALSEQSWELQLRSFGAHRQHWHRTCQHAIILPFPPLLSVDKVTYSDVNGADQVLVLGADYRVLGMGQVYGKAYIAPLYGASWPVCRVDDASVRVRFTCGYDGDDAIMPASLKAAIILGVRALMSSSARDGMLFEDSVAGLGYKRYQNNPQAAAKVVTDAVKSLLINLQIS